jgi:hypothetical protein
MNPHGRGRHRDKVGAAQTRLGQSSARTVGWASEDRGAEGGARGRVALERAPAARKQPDHAGPTTRVAFDAWRGWWLRGGRACPEVLDDEAEEFGREDLAGEERKVARSGLRRCLLQGQAGWRQDGGVVARGQAVDPEMKRLEEWIQR